MQYRLDPVASYALTLTQQQTRREEARRVHTSPTFLLIIPYVSIAFFVFVTSLSTAGVVFHLWGHLRVVLFFMLGILWMEEKEQEELETN